MQIKYITGGAGTGKSTMLRKLIEEETEPHAVCAPTGMAAINAGGQTIHKLFNIGMDGAVGYGIHRSILKKVQRVYVDEMSMVSDELLQAMQEGFDKLNISPQVVAFGDLAQLKPVKAEYFFHSYKPEEVVRLEQNYRQSSDLDYANVLNSIRMGKVGKAQLEYINEHLENSEDDLSDYITMAFSNATVDYINSQRLNAVPGEARLFMGQLKGNFQEKECRAPLELSLKIGAKIILLNNDLENRWQNGSRGTVQQFDEDKGFITVILDRDGSEVRVSKHNWFKEEDAVLTPVKQQLYERMLEQPEELQDRRTDIFRIERILRTGIDKIVVGAYTQYPIKLGYASTVHKAQGQTLEKVHIIPEGFGKEHGLMYVALSRLTNINGLSMPRYVNVFDFKFDKKVLPYL
jgi:ATP-dependent DNA helicase PIF1